MIDPSNTGHVIQGRSRTDPSCQVGALIQVVGPALPARWCGGTGLPPGSLGKKTLEEPSESSSLGGFVR